MKDNKTTILLVDDEVKIVFVLKDYLNALGYEVLTANDGEEALEVFYENSKYIDLILLDVMMPKMDGVEVLKELRKISMVPVIFLTAKGEEYDQIKGFKTGADDYITKPFSQSVLVLRIEAVLTRLGGSSKKELYANGISVNQVNRVAKIDGNEIELTRREFDLLSYFIMNKNQVLTREQLLNSVWGYDFYGEQRTVDTHVKQLRGKIGDHASSLKTIHGIGYRLEVIE